MSAAVSPTCAVLPITSVRNSASLVAHCPCVRLVPHCEADRPACFEAWRHHFRKMSAACTTQCRDLRGIDVEFVEPDVIHFLSNLLADHAPGPKGLAHDPFTVDVCKSASALS